MAINAIYAGPELNLGLFLTGMVIFFLSLLYCFAQSPPKPGPQDGAGLILGARLRLWFVQER